MKLADNIQAWEANTFNKLESWYKVKNMVPMSNNSIGKMIDYIKINDSEESGFNSNSMSFVNSKKANNIIEDKYL